jgi:tetratricopeptide (TPR) repeat protein
VFSCVSWTVAVLLLIGAAVVQAARDRTSSRATDEVDDAIYISSPAALRRLTPGFTALAADLYWIRAIQYYGGTKRRLDARAPALAAAPKLTDTGDYRHLYELLDITTSLDPRFDIAYRFGAIFLAEAFPEGPGRPDLAVKLLEKGLQNRPEKWQYMEDVGFIYYWYLGDYRQAADAFAKAADIPGAPNWLRPLAATTLAEGGDRRTSRAMWLSILESADFEWLRVQAERRLLQLRAMDDLDLLREKVREYTSRTGETPRDWSALVRAGFLRGVPRDPAGTAYALTSSGDVRLGDSSSLNPLPAEPHHLSPAA